MGPRISCLDLSHNPLIGDVGVRELAEGVRVSGAIIELRLRDVGMGAEGAKALAEAVGRGARALRRCDREEGEGVGSQMYEQGVKFPLVLDSPSECCPHVIPLSPHPLSLSLLSGST